MKRNLFLIILISFMVSSCSVYHVSSKDASRDFYPPKKSPLEVVYVEEVTDPHEVIGVVTVRTERRQSISTILERMKYEAAILGGDAITDIQSDATGTWKKFRIPKRLKNAYLRSKFNAKVIVHQ